MFLEEPEFKNYKERQAFYREISKNGGKTIHLSKVVGRDGKVLQKGSTYTSDKGDIRKIKRAAKHR